MFRIVLFYCNSTELATAHAAAATDTSLRIDGVRVLDRTTDGLYWTIAGTCRTTFTLVSVDGVSYEACALVCGTTMVNHVGEIFVAEVCQCRKNRVWRGLTKSAEGSVLDDLGEVFKVLEVFHCGATLCYLVEKLVEALVTNTAWGALTAALFNGEVKVEFSDSDHTVVLVHDNHTTRTHH